MSGRRGGSISQRIENSSPSRNECGCGGGGGTDVGMAGIVVPGRSEPPERETGAASTPLPERMMRYTGVLMGWSSDLNVMSPE